MSDRLLYAYLNHKKKLAFIGIYNVAGNINKNSSLTAHYSKARYIYEEALKGSRSNTVLKSFDNGFYISLINTELSDWIRIGLTAGPIPASKAMQIRSRHYDRLDKLGFREIGSRYFRYNEPGESDNKSSKWGSGLIKNMNKEKIETEIHKMTAGLDYPITDDFINRIYLDSMRLESINTKADLFLHIKSIIIQLSVNRVIEII